MLCLQAAACQPLPHPFAEDRPPPRAPIMALKDTAGVTVAPVAGVPAAAQDALADAMAAQLQDAEILATTQSRNHGSYSLLGAARNGGDGKDAGSLTVIWRLVDPDGRDLGQATGSASVAPDALSRGDPEALKRLAAAAAPAVALLLQDDAPVPAAPSDKPDLREVAVWPVTGAPGDGRQALTRAMAQALARAQITVLAGEGDGKGLAVVGTVNVAAAKAGLQQVRITWALLEPDGKQVGIVSQENSVPAGSLDRIWGDVAFAVAEAAAPGIVALIEKAEQLRAGS